MALRDADVDRVADLIGESAASELLPRFRKLDPHDIREKRPGDLVTVADEACERRLAAGLAAILPGVPVVGEEAVAAEPGLLAHIGEAEMAWIVDPLDGTANFARDSDRFAVIVALVKRGETVAAWIHDPIRGRMATAVQGGGARLDGQPVRLASSLPPGRRTGFVGAKVKRELLRRPRPEILDQLGRLATFGCAGLEYLEMLSGRSHFAFYRWTRPWDHAAGALLVHEAGGAARRRDGRPYSPTQPVDAGILAAAEPARWQALCDLMGEALAPRKGV
jgi:fructose-1,6-bisphosphatase/inositol monophosphatase family enzyme